jgi:hypothetical protein
LKVSTVHFGTDQSSGPVESCHSGPRASLSPPSRSPPLATFLYARRSHRWLPALYSTALGPPSVTRYNKHLALRAICQTPLRLSLQCVQAPFFLPRSTLLRLQEAAGASLGAIMPRHTSALAKSTNRCEPPHTLSSATPLHQAKRICSFPHPR